MHSKSPSYCQLIVAIAVRIHAIYAIAVRYHTLPTQRILGIALPLRHIAVIHLALALPRNSKLLSALLTPFIVPLFSANAVI